jgi:DNA-binding NtrC family response regulator
VERVSSEALSILSSYNWPGNIRELQNAIERAVLVCRGTVIEPEHVPLLKNEKDRTLDDKSLASIEKDHIEAILGETDWNISQSARVLGIDRVTLYNKIKKYGLKREDSAATN